MKKLFSLIAICAATTAVQAEPMYGDYEFWSSTYSYNAKPQKYSSKSDCYVTGRVDFSFLNFKNKYSSTFPYVDNAFNSDSYSFEPVLGLDIAVGTHLDEDWRGDLELGYVGRFVDTGDMFKYKLSVPYLMANGYYDFAGGLYLGLGAGIAMPTMHVEMADLDNGSNQTKTSGGFIGAFSIGYSYKLDDDLFLDLRYRMAGITGLKHTRNFSIGANTYSLTVNTNFIWDNSVSMGLRYEF